MPAGAFLGHYLVRLYLVLGAINQHLAKHNLLKRYLFNAKHQPWRKMAFKSLLMPPWIAS